MASSPKTLSSAPSPSDPTRPPPQSPARLHAPPPPPPEREFASREELLSFLRAFTVAHGYAVVISKSNVPRGQLWLRCDLGGSQRAPSPSAPCGGGGGSRKRKSASRRQECPFQLYARRLPTARWALRVQDARHNHDAAAAAEQMHAHPVARRLSLEQKLLVQELTARGTRPAVIVERLKDRFPGKPVKVQDIYNVRNFMRRERNAGREPFARPDAWTAAQLPVGDVVRLGDDGAAPCRAPPPSPSAGVACHEQQALKQARQADAQLRSALERVSREFPRWRGQRQRSFVSQLERLLDEFSQAEAACDASEEQLACDGAGDERQDSELAVAAAGQPLLLTDGARGLPSPIEQTEPDLLLAPPASPHPSSAPPTPPFQDKSESIQVADASARPTVSL